MPFITREDGEHFVIPSYRDVISAKQKAVVKKEILSLSQNYGDYITLQKKSGFQYEVAFSPDTGYLLGETVWHHFNKPADLIYCEAIPGTAEAILVVVKSGSVYLDGSFPLESIQEELVVFLTQQNNFEIYIYGDVPIAKTAEADKFAFEETSVKSFKILEEPVFPKLPLLKTYQLQLVDIVLKAHGIGVFPIKETVIGAVAIVMLYLLWSYLTAPVEAPPPVVVKRDQYLEYRKELQSPAPSDVIEKSLQAIDELSTIPGWTAQSFIYENGTITAQMLSLGGDIESLMAWTAEKQMEMELTSKGIQLTKKLPLQNRIKPMNIYSTKELIAKVIDEIHTIYAGNPITLGTSRDYGVFDSVPMTISLKDASPMLFHLLSDKLIDKPLVIKKIEFKQETSMMNGTITLEILGSKS